MTSLAVAGQRFARRCADRGIRLARSRVSRRDIPDSSWCCTGRSRCPMLVRAERERARADRLRLLRVGRPVRVDLIRQHALHIILHTHIVYNGDAAVRGAAVDKIAVPLVALEPRQTCCSDEWRYGLAPAADVYSTEPLLGIAAPERHRITQLDGQLAAAQRSAGCS